MVRVTLRDRRRAFCIREQTWVKDILWVPIDESIEVDEIRVTRRRDDARKFGSKGLISGRAVWEQFEVYAVDVCMSGFLAL